MIIRPLDFYHSLVALFSNSSLALYQRRIARIQAGTSGTQKV